MVGGIAMGARYSRALTDESFLNKLVPGGPLAFLVQGIEGLVPGDPYPLDIQLREDNDIMYYHGTTCLLTLSFRVQHGTVMIKPSAHDTYSGPTSKCRPAFLELKRHCADKPHKVHGAFCNYLAEAIHKANSRFYKNRKEGWWQNRLCIRFGRDFLPDDDWLVIDRECVIGFGNRKEKRTVYDPLLKKYECVRDRLQQDDPKRWGRSNQEKERKGQRSEYFGNELDILAIDRYGNLLAMELKHGGNAKGIYWGPLQVSAYRDAFSSYLPVISDGIRALVKQKIKLGLLPRHAWDRLCGGGLRRVTSVLSVGDPKEASSCWGKMNEVLQVAGLAIQITEVNVHSGGVPAITRTYAAGGTS